MSKLNFGLLLDPFPRPERVTSYAFTYENVSEEQEELIKEEFWKFKRAIDTLMLGLDR